MGELRLANLSNGIAFPHDDVCYFQSNHGHNCKMGYFRHDAMPPQAIIHLLTGGEITIVDATAKNKSLTDAQKFGVPTFCLVFNRAIKRRDIKVCSWQTREMEKVAYADIHKKLVQTIRKLVRIYGHSGPITIGQKMKFVCHAGFPMDDKPALLAEAINATPKI